jgi:hypothetical protein
VFDFCFGLFFLVLSMVWASLLAVLFMYLALFHCFVLFAHCFLIASSMVLARFSWFCLWFWLGFVIPVYGAGVNDKYSWNHKRVWLVFSMVCLLFWLVVPGLSIVSAYFPCMSSVSAYLFTFLCIVLACLFHGFDHGYGLFSLFCLLIGLFFSWFVYCFGLLVHGFVYRHWRKNKPTQ